jgi:hypothetical protein
VETCKCLQNHCRQDLTQVTMGKPNSTVTAAIEATLHLAEGVEVSFDDKVGAVAGLLRVRPDRSNHRLRPGRSHRPLHANRSRVS